ncbi:NACHT, LRR and PYD domains-containing protein 3-like [Lissotriton helveticus]
MADVGSTSGDILLHALEDLTEAEFKRFKNKLSEINFKGKQNIPRGSLEKADPIDTKHLLVQFYGSDSAIEVTIEGFTKVSLREASARLRGKRMRVSDPHEAQEVPGETSDFRRRYMEHIVEHCRLIEDRNARMGEAVPLQKRYTKLLIVQNPRDEEEHQHEVMSHGWRHTAMMDGLAHSKHYIHLDALFDSMEDGHRPRTIVLQGPAGIGKTITAQKLMLDWALGEIYQGLFDYMFYLSCREINQVTNNKSVFDVIGARCPDRTVPASVLLADPSKILLILDGFDELKFSLSLKEDQHCRDPWQKNPVEVTLSNLLRRNILSGCSLIITTRPAALARLKLCIKADLCAEIMGFTEEDRRSYFKGFFENDEQASRALAVVKDNDTLYTMCFLPIVCWIVCTVMKQQLDRRQDIANSSKTTTSVYLFFLSTLLRDHSGASVQTMQRSLKKLCSLALNGIFEQQILFDEEYLTQSGLEVSDIPSLFLNQTIFQQDIDVYSAYSFIHLSFQEFFAALFYILDLDVGTPNPQRDLKQLLKEYSEMTKGHLMLTVRFLCGLINKDQVRHLEKFLGCKISHSARAGLVAWLQEPKEKWLLPDVLHCLHESQDKEITSRAMDNIQSIKLYDPNIVNWKAISFCLKHCQGDKTLKMSDIYFGPKAQEIMRPGLINCSTLRFSDCEMVDEVLPPYFYTYFKKKREPEVSVLYAALRDPQSRLKELRSKKTLRNRRTARLESKRPAPEPDNIFGTEDEEVVEIQDQDEPSEQGSTHGSDYEADEEEYLKEEENYEVDSEQNETQASTVENENESATGSSRRQGLEALGADETDEGLRCGELPEGPRLE